MSKAWKYALIGTAVLPLLIYTALMPAFVFYIIYFLPIIIPSHVIGVFIGGLVTTRGHQAISQSAAAQIHRPSRR